MFLTNNIKDIKDIKDISNNIIWFLIITIGFLLTIAIGFLVSNNASELAWVILGCLAIGFWVFYPEKLFCYWLVLFPIADYLIRYPKQQAIITFERVFIVVLSLGILIRLVKNEKIKLKLGWFEISWMLFALYALGDCLLQENFSLSTLRTAVDGFILPLVLFVIIKESLDIKSISKKIFIGLIALSYLILPIGILELLTGIDLLAYPGGEIFFDGRIRPNGAFLSDHSYALISLILGLVLLYWPRVAGINVLGKYRLIWYGAIISAFLSALIPQFRAIMLIMLISLALGRYLISGWRSLITPFAAFLILIIAATPIWLFLSSTRFYQQRIADTANFSSRVVTYKKALEVAQSNPFGVGLGNYENYFNKRWEVKEHPEKLGEIAQSTPHSNFLSVLAELGIIGFILYLIAHLTLIYTAWKTAKFSNHTAGVTVLLLVIVYAGVGFTLTSGYYYDLNLFFFCSLGILLARVEET
ncbi:MAG: O-antigen ligase family protein [Acidobacteria bacterium]|nr:O-antigen ligase family protein [Acidobacteriota bacterium]